ncbi:MAG: glycoside hydrolase family 2 TIM barrel-domain containing protein [Candidatus Sericytochromatia bacterium]|nr:glycoside hydrolase family 2 TIM barrel-domain containing protein [Candidatus Sericytochromatia bacterium]
MVTLDLSGPWQLRPVATSDGPPAPEDGWHEQQLPAHWQEHPALSTHTGTVWYRKRFSFTAPDQAGLSHHLRLRGVFYRFRIHLNGQFVGASEGYFFPQDFDITAALRAENELLIEVESPIERSCLEKETITGVFAHWDALSSYRYNAGGLWLPVEIVSRPALSIASALWHLTDFNDTQAEVSMRVDVRVPEACQGAWQVTFSPHNFAGEAQHFEGLVTLPAGRYGWHHHLKLPQYRLWWTHDLGFPALYRVQVTLTVGEQRTAWETITGLRTWEMRDYIAYLNGRRLYVKGSNYPPGDARLASMTPERAHIDLQWAKQAHMNMLRVHAHVDHPALYGAADEAGVLLWQDFPLQWLYARKILPEALRQSQEMVRMLHHHPSIVIWCLHNEPLHVDDTSVEPLLRQLRTYWSLFRSWNRDVMGSQLVQAVSHLDQSRTVIRSSGEMWIPGWLSGTDGHYYFGWYMSYGPKRWFDLWRRLFPRNLRFVTEFGAQSFPNYEHARTFLPDDLRGSDWRHLNRQYLLQWELMSLWIDTGSHQLAPLVEASQTYQAELQRYYVDRLRFHKYRPNGGFLNFMFTDSQPGVSWSIIDYWRSPKQSYHAYKLALSPQYVFCLTPRDRYRPGKRYRLPIHVVNDAHEPRQVAIAVSLLAPDGRAQHEQTHHLTLEADCQAVSLGLLPFQPTSEGNWQLRLTLSQPGETDLVNAYDLPVGR